MENEWKWKENEWKWKENEWKWKENEGLCFSRRDSCCCCCCCFFLFSLCLVLSCPSLLFRTGFKNIFALNMKNLVTPKILAYFIARGGYYQFLEKWRTLFCTGLLMRFKHYCVATEAVVMMFLLTGNIRSLCRGECYLARMAAHKDMLGLGNDQFDWN